MDHAKKLFKRRQMRVRSKLRQAKVARPRLSIFRSGRHIYAQIIDDAAGRTLAMSSTLDKDLKGSIKSTGSIEAAGAVGKAVAERAKSAGVSEVVFDRGGYRYHGRIKALAEAAREAGLVF
jgi:large subunit ribosomal protein L18